MRRFIPVLAILFWGAFFAAAPASAQTAVKLSNGYELPMHFPTGGYWPWERMGPAAKRAGFDDPWPYAEKMLRELKQKHHWNTVWVLNIGTADARRFLELAEKTGMWVMLAASHYEHTYIHYSHASMADIRPAAKKMVDDFGKYKALAGYVLGDEPRTVNLSFLEAFRRELRKLDRSRVSLTVTTTRALGGAARRTELPVIVPDPYYFGYPRNPNLPNRPVSSRAGYVTCIKYLGELASDNNRRAWVMPQMFQSAWGPWYYDKDQCVVAEKGASLHWRMPTLGEVRWQIWCAAAGNVKGVLFYVLFPPHHPRKKGAALTKRERVPDGLPKVAVDFATGDGRAMLFSDSTPTPQMTASSEVFAFIRENEKLLDRLEPLLPEIAYATPPAQASSFEDPQTGLLYTVVFSNDTDKSIDAQLSFLQPMESVRDMRMGKKLDVTQEPGGLLRVKLGLRAGDGTVLALTPSAGEPPMSVLNEDFSLTIRAKMANARRAIIKRQYGLGWEFCIVPDQNDGEPQRPGSITFPLVGHRKMILNSYPKNAVVYVVYHGVLARKDQESLILCTSKDGKAFGWTSTGTPGFPVEIPRDAKSIRFDVKPGARLGGFEVIAVPRPQAK